MRVDVLDPSAFTPPYDRALCAALARAGHDVRLLTSRFVFGDVPPADGFPVEERFYRWQPRRGRTAAKLLQHVPDLLAYRPRDVAHFQWVDVQPLDVHLLPRRTPTVLTAHDVLPREPRPGQVRAQRRLYERVDAVVVHTEHGAARLRALGVPEPHVIPHGVLDWLTRVPSRRPPELPAKRGPTVLFFGLVRPYKGLDVLQRARFDADLWVVGMPRTEVAPPRDREHQVLRFVSDAEAAWCFREADVVVLPYREIEQSGVLFTAMGFGTPVVLSDVGGFSEVAAARTVPAGDPDALGAAIDEVLADPAPHAARMREAAATTYAWDGIARRHAELYARITGA